MYTGRSYNPEKVKPPKQAKMMGPKTKGARYRQAPRQKMPKALQERPMGKIPGYSKKGY